MANNISIDGINQQHQSTAPINSTNQQHQINSIKSTASISLTLNFEFPTPKMCWNAYRHGRR